MWHDRRGAVNWTALIALAACLAAGAAVRIAVSVSKQVRLDAQRRDAGAGLDALWHLTAEWHATEMAGTRNAAAAALLNGQVTRELEDILAFFDEVALLVDRGVLDEELVWHELYWPIANYWFARRTQDGDVTAPALEHLDALVPRLQILEARHRHRRMDETAPSKAEMRDFLTEEAGSAECTEDEDEAATRKMPL